MNGRWVMALAPATRRRAISRPRIRRSITAARSARQHDRGEGQRVAQRGEHQRPQHAEIHAGRAGQRDGVRLVQRVPPVHAELDDRQVDHADQRQDGAGAIAAHRVVERAHQGDMAEIQEEQHQDRGQPRVPHPPGAPHRLAPQAAGGEAQRGEAGADRADLRPPRGRPADAARPATAPSTPPGRYSRRRPARPPARGYT